MINRVWKSFAANKVSHSMAHYLTTVHALRERRGYARVSDVAEELQVKKGSVSHQMKQLKAKGFVLEDEKRHLQLTELGESLAVQVLRSRRVMIEFMQSILGVSSEQAESDACKIEHLLSRETTQRLWSLVELLSSDDDDAAEFRGKLKSFQLQCPSLENCNLCEDQCLVEVDPSSDCGRRSEDAGGD